MTSGKSAALAACVLAGALGGAANAQAAGLHVASARNPLTSLADAATEPRRRIPGDERKPHPMNTTDRANVT
jgi:hypothetical protein